MMHLIINGMAITPSWPVEIVQARSYRERVERLGGEAQWNEQWRRRMDAAKAYAGRAALESRND